MEAVRRKLDGLPIVYPESCQRNSAKHSYQHHVKFWVAKFQSGGEEALRHGKNRKFTIEQKIIAIMPILNGDISLTKQSQILGIDIGTLTAWIKHYGKNGVKGLEFSKRGRKPKNMEQTKQQEHKVNEDTVKVNGNIKNIDKISTV